MPHTTFRPRTFAFVRFVASSLPKLKNLGIVGLKIKCISEKFRDDPNSSFHILVIRISCKTLFLTYERINIYVNDYTFMLLIIKIVLCFRIKFDLKNKFTSTFFYLTATTISRIIQALQIRHLKTSY